jgi:hypothetical protein
MPTILRIRGYRVVIYPADHRPAHVHVVGADGEAVFLLNCPAGPVVLREVWGLSAQTARGVAAELAEHLAALCAAWSVQHGDF